MLCGFGKLCVPVRWIHDCRVRACCGGAALRRGQRDGRDRWVRRLHAGLICPGPGLTVVWEVVCTWIWTHVECRTAVGSSGERRREGAEEAEERGERRGGESLRFRNSSHVYASVCVMCDSLSLPEHTTLSPEHNNDYFPGTPRPHTLPPIQPARLRLRPLPPCTPLPSSPPRPANHAAAAEPSRAPSRFYSRFSEPDPALRAACRVDPAEGALGGLEVADVLLAHRPVQHCTRADQARLIISLVARSSLWLDETERSERRHKQRVVDVSSAAASSRRRQPPQARSVWCGVPRWAE